MNLNFCSYRDINEIVGISTDLHYFMLLYHICHMNNILKHGTSSSALFGYGWWPFTLYIYKKKDKSSANLILTASLFLKLYEQKSLFKLDWDDLCFWLKKLIVIIVFYTKTVYYSVINHPLSVVPRWGSLLKKMTNSQKKSPPVIICGD